MRDPDRRRRVGDAARARAEQRYDATRQFQILAGHLREAIALHQTRRTAPAEVPAANAAR